MGTIFASVARQRETDKGTTKKGVQEREDHKLSVSKMGVGEKDP